MIAIGHGLGIPFPLLGDSEGGGGVSGPGWIITIGLANNPGSGTFIITMGLY